MAVQLIAGMFLGSIFTLFIWSIFLKATKTKAEKSQHEREEIMRSVGKLLTEVDELFSSRRNGTIENMRFQDAFSSKVEAINRMLKPSLHVLDIYYIKYVENLIGEYRREAQSGEQPLDKVSGTVSGSEMETGAGAAGVAAFADTSTVMEGTGKDSTELIKGEEEAVSEIPPISVDKEALFAVEEEEPPFAPETKVISAPLVKPDIGASGALADEVHKLEDAVSVDKETPSTGEEIALLEEPEKAPDIQPVSIFHDEAAELEKVAISSIDEEPAYFEVEESVNVETQEISPMSIPQEKPDAVEAATAVEGGKAVFEADGKSSAVSPPAAKKEHELFGEEDFSMETLIDVDINTISPFLKEGIADTHVKKAQEQESSLFEVVIDKEESQEPADKGDGLEVVIAPNVGHIEAPSKEEFKATEKPEVAPVKKDKKIEEGDSKKGDTIPEETTFTRVEDLAPKGKYETESVSKDEEPVEIFESAPVSPSTVHSNKTSHEKASTGVTDADIEAFDREEEIITGDDVAEKIASLEFHKQTPPAKPPKKEKRKEKSASGKTSASKPHAHSAKKPSASATSPSKNRDDGDTITGDDVAHKIDAFFGLIDK